MTSRGTKFPDTSECLLDCSGWYGVLYMMWRAPRQSDDCSLASIGALPNQAGPSVWADQRSQRRLNSDRSSEYYPCKYSKHCRPVFGFSRVAELRDSVQPACWCGSRRFYTNFQDTIQQLGDLLKAADVGTSGAARDTCRVSLGRSPYFVAACPYSGSCQVYVTCYEAVSDRGDLQREGVSPLGLS